MRVDDMLEFGDADLYDVSGFDPSKLRGFSGQHQLDPGDSSAAVTDYLSTQMKEAEARAAAQSKPSAGNLLQKYRTPLIIGGAVLGGLALSVFVMKMVGKKRYR